MQEELCVAHSYIIYDDGALVEVLKLYISGFHDEFLENYFKLFQTSLFTFRVITNVILIFIL